APSAPARNIFSVKLKRGAVKRRPARLRKRNSLARIYGRSRKICGEGFATSRRTITLCQALSLVCANARNIVPVSLWSGRRIGKRGSRPQAHRLIRRRRRLANVRMNCGAASTKEVHHVRPPHATKRRQQRRAEAARGAAAGPG